MQNVLVGLAAVRMLLETAAGESQNQATVSEETPHLQM